MRMIPIKTILILIFAVFSAHAQDCQDGAVPSSALKFQGTGELASMIARMKPDYMNMRCDELKKAFSDDLALVQRLESDSGVSVREIEPALIESTRRSLDALKRDLQANKIPPGMRQRLTPKYPFLAFYVDGTPVDFVPGAAQFKADILRQVDEGRAKVDGVGKSLHAANEDASIPELLKQTRVKCRPSCPSMMNCAANLGGFWLPLPE